MGEESHYRWNEEVKNNNPVLSKKKCKPIDSVNKSSWKALI